MVSVSDAEPSVPLQRLLQGITIGRKEEVVRLLEHSSVADQREMFRRMEPGQLAELCRLVAFQQGMEAVARLSTARQERLMNELTPEERERLYELYRTDDLTSLLASLDSTRRTEELQRLPESRRHQIETLLTYPPESVGRLMTPVYLEIHPEWTVERSLAELRHQEPKLESTKKAFVVNDENVLLDDISVRHMVLSDPETRIEELMDETAVVLYPEQDREEAVNILDEQHETALPVVDDTRHMLGVVTMDDILRVAQREETEDYQRLGASEPLNQPYFASSIRRLARKRVGWLFFLFFAGALSSAVLDYFEETLEQVLLLSFFIPLMVGTGGNAGSQTVTTVIRALAIGNIQFTDLPRVMLREFSIGLLVGSFLGGAGFLFAWGYWDASVPVAMIIGLAMPAICILATLVASVTPLVADLVGIDPTVISAPLITTVVDVGGLILYFMLAGWILGL